jgi:hypothetical protein
MTRHIFPYGIRLRGDRHVEVFPAAEVYLKGRGARGIRATFHIDSGAVVSVLPADDARTLGIPLAAGQQAFVQGVASELLQGYQHMIAVEIGNERIKIPVIFIDHPDVPRILGRDGVFSRFIIMFDEVRRRVAFLGSTADRDAVDPFFSDDTPD